MGVEEEWGLKPPPTFPIHTYNPPTHIKKTPDGESLSLTSINIFQEQCHGTPFTSKSKVSCGVELS
jgi:hypothetical protein